MAVAWPWVAYRLYADFEFTAISGRTRAVIIERREAEVIDELSQVIESSLHAIEGALDVSNGISADGEFFAHFPAGDAVRCHSSGSSFLRVRQS